jgi:putative aldouronate transport system permease protein
VIAKKRQAGEVIPVYKRFTKEAIVKDFKRNKVAYLMAVPAIIMLILFSYLPMFGVVMAFENYKPKLGIFGSSIVGFKNFIDFFQSIYFVRVVKNTLILSGLQLLIEFPASIIFALLLNEVRSKWFKSATQTISYMPNFISMVVVSGIIIDFCSSKGVLTSFISNFTGSTQNLLSVPGNWRAIYIVSDLWQGLGMGSIVFLAALAGIDQELYEAAVIDGANRWKQTIHVTLTGIMPTIIIMLIMRVGMMMSVGSEKTILLYNSQVYETADIISSYVYRKGLVEFNYGYSTAVSLFNSIINFTLLVVTNHISKKSSETSLF